MNDGDSEQRPSARCLGRMPHDLGFRHVRIMFEHERRNWLAVLCTTANSGECNERADIIAGTPKGLFVKNLSGGSVDTVSGQFNFIVREAYLIENGKITSPVAGATLIGRGIDVLQYIDAVGDDLALGPGICGKDQWVAVTAGQPTVRVASGITVGGSE